MGTDWMNRAYWEDPEPDVRLNPRMAWDWNGIREGLRHERERLRQHVLFATSGSLSGPKLVCLSKEALLASAEAVNAHLECGMRDRWANSLPAFHVGGFGLWARAYVAGGCVVLAGGKWDAARFVEECEREDVTVTSLVPAQVFDVVALGKRAPERLRAVVVGGGTLDAVLGQRARELGWPVLASYGMTETASQVATQGLAEVAEPFDVACGLPLVPSWEVRCDVGDPAAVRVRGGALFSGYLANRGGHWRFEEAALEEGGWFDTGDVGSMNGAGRLRVQGRRARVVKVLGELVDLDRLEGIARELAGATLGGEVAVMAKPDERAGHRVVLITGTGISEAEGEALSAAFNAEVAPFERVSEVTRVAKLPRGALGKIAYGSLGAGQGSEEGT